MGGYRHSSIGFLTDYGLTDEFVGVCHGVMRCLAPEATVIDITHGIPPHDVVAGAIALARAVAYLPTGVLLAVVDPGVGSARLGVVVVTGEGSCLVGPDNGLLLPAAERLGGAEACFALENRSLQAQRVSATFHGRDIFAPAAAHLARGVEPSAFGPPVPLADLLRAAIPGAEVGEGRCVGVVLSVDRFGNLETSIDPGDLAAAGLLPGSRLGLTVGPVRAVAPYGTTFSDAPPGEPVVLEDSRGLVAVCLNQSSAAIVFSAAAGTHIALEREG
ncbi:MAG: SAM hydrolase/SAM-dependent halogenase family protein [Actinomycetota bacterium]